MARTRPTPNSSMRCARWRFSMRLTTLNYGKSSAFPPGLIYLTTFALPGGSSFKLVTVGVVFVSTVGVVLATVVFVLEGSVVFVGVVLATVGVVFVVHRLISHRIFFGGV